MFYLPIHGWFHILAAEDGAALTPECSCCFDWLVFLPLDVYPMSFWAFSMILDALGSFFSPMHNETLHGALVSSPTHSAGYWRHSFQLGTSIFHPQRFHLYQGLSSGDLCVFLNVYYSDSAPQRFKVDFSSPFLLILYDLNLGLTFGGDRFIFMLQIVHSLLGGDNVLLSLPCSSFASPLSTGLLPLPLQVTGSFCCSILCLILWGPLFC